MKKQTDKLEVLKAIARAHSKRKGRKRLMTDEQLNLVRSMRSSNITHRAIYEAMKDQKMMPYKSFGCFYTAYKNR